MLSTFLCLACSSTKLGPGRPLPKRAIEVPHLHHQYHLCNDESIKRANIILSPAFCLRFSLGKSRILSRHSYCPQEASLMHSHLHELTCMLCIGYFNQHHGMLEVGHVAWKLQLITLFDKLISMYIFVLHVVS